MTAPLGTTPVGRQLTRDEAAAQARPLWEQDEPLDLLALLRRPAWTADALCREHPEIDWFPRKGDASATLAAAREVCGRCLVQQECLDYAMSTWETRTHGVWAGTSVLERRTLRRSAAA